jgi:hypothetical protein
MACFMGATPVPIPLVPGRFPLDLDELRSIARTPCSLQQPQEPHRGVTRGDIEGIAAIAMARPSCSLTDSAAHPV